MNVTSISWTDLSWNPVRGCSRVSEGCRNCYAEKIAARFGARGKPFEGFVYLRPINEGTAPMERNPAYLKDLSLAGKWTGKVELIEKHLLDPLKWRKPRKIFVNSMSDLFHENLPDEAIDRVFAVMALCPRHTFQVLTKRGERLFKWGARKYLPGDIQMHVNALIDRHKIPGSPAARHSNQPIIRKMFDGDPPYEEAADFQDTDIWPLPNIQLGVSVEDQATADERIPWLLKTPAAVRFVSYEPALGTVDFDSETRDGLHALGCGDSDHRHRAECAGLDWIIVGGESGPGARPFDIQWARNTVAQCKAAGVACFVKQLGTHPYPGSLGSGRMPEMALKDRKGGDWNEWPEDLRVREFPDCGGNK